MTLKTGVMDTFYVSIYFIFSLIIYLIYFLLFSFFLFLYKHSAVTYKFAVLHIY